MDQETEAGEARRHHIYVPEVYRINIGNDEVNKFLRYGNKGKGTQCLRYGDKDEANQFLKYGDKGEAIMCLRYGDKCEPS
jgi:hypothetical protein